MPLILSHQPIPLARSLLLTEEGAFFLLGVSDFEDALARCDSDAEREAVARRVIQMERSTTEDDE